MSVKDFVTALQCCIKEEFIAVSETVENVIRVRFIDGKLINIIVTLNTLSITIITKSYLSTFVTLNQRMQKADSPYNDINSGHPLFR